MYICRSDENKYLVKRMPLTGVLHDPGCDSYEMPPELSGRGALGQKAIQEDENEGLTRLRLDFSMSKRATSAAPATKTKTAGNQQPSVSADPAKLSLRSLLHLLYEDAGLNRWSPRMAGKRNWFIVRKYLTEAACGKVAGRRPITDTLLIPEPFSVELKDTILDRRSHYFANLKESGSKQPLGLLIGEVKNIEPARFGYRMMIKHLPDLPLYLPDNLHERLSKNFSTELAFFNEDPSIHLVCICTFTRSPTGNLQADTLSLMPVDQNWLPFEDRSELDLIDRLVRHGRYFTKCLRYNLKQSDAIASLLLTDTADTPTVVYVMPESVTDTYHEKLNWLLENSELPYELINAGAIPDTGIPLDNA